MFLFHQKTLFFSFLYFGAAADSGEIPSHTRYTFICPFQFCLRTLSQCTHRKMLFLPHSGVRRSLFLRAQKRLVRNGQVCAGVSVPLSMAKKMGSHAELKERERANIVLRMHLHHQAKALIYFFWGQFISTINCYKMNMVRNNFPVWRRRKIKQVCACVLLHHIYIYKRLAPLSFCAVCFRVLRKHRRIPHLYKSVPKIVQKRA